MKKKQSVLIIIVLFTSFLVGAQDKYEFMIIEYNRILKEEIIISIDGKEFLTEKANFQDKKNIHVNANPLLLKVREYQDKGWEVMNLQISFDNSNNSSNLSRVYFAYLRRKKLD